MHPGRKSLENIKDRIISVLVDQIREARSKDENLSRRTWEMTGTVRAYGIVQDEIDRWDEEEKRVSRIHKSHSPFYFDADKKKQGPPFSHGSLSDKKEDETPCPVPRRLEEFLAPHNMLGAYQNNFRKRPVNFEGVATSTFWNDCRPVDYINKAFSWDDTPEGLLVWGKLNSTWQSLVSYETDKKD